MSAMPLDQFINPPKEIIAVNPCKALNEIVVSYARIDNAQSEAKE